VTTPYDTYEPLTQLMIINKSNFRSGKVYAPIYREFETEHFLKGRHSVSVNNRTMSDAAYEKKRCRAILEKHTRKSKWRRLLDVDLVFGGMHCGNLPPLLLKELVAPMFFEDFPNGKIFYVPDSELRSIEMLKVERDLGIKYQSRYDGFAPPHPSSNLNLDLSLRATGIDIALGLTFPFLMGINAPLAFGNFIFLTGNPIPAWDKNSFSAQDLLSIGVSGVYTDSQTPSRGVKRPIFIDTYSGRGVFKSTDYDSYLVWYISTYQKLYGFLNALSDKEHAFLASLSIARIMAETYLAILSDVPLIRLMLAFAVLDKYANLSSQLGFSSLTEPDIWEHMLSPAFFSKTSRMFGQVPGLGHFLTLLNDGIGEELNSITHESNLETLRSDLKANKLMRIYRNSYHGYLLHDDVHRKTLLSHSGDIFNEFADIAVLLWNAFVLDPSKFLEIESH
jgi:hypothetical protein